MSKSKPSKKVARSWQQAESVLALGLVLAGSLLGLLFDPEDGVGMFLTLSHLRREYSSVFITVNIPGLGG
jgi:hypothetical protein